VHWGTMIVALHLIVFGYTVGAALLVVCFTTLDRFAILIASTTPLNTAHVNHNSRRPHRRGQLMLVHVTCE